MLLPVTIPAGQDRATVQVCTVADSIHENDETLLVEITAATGASLSTVTQAVGTIIDNETPPLTLLQQCELLHGPGWAPVLYPNGTPWTDSFGQIVCAMPH